ncbi:Gfo/Idh/MocA family protein [Aquipuribacter nitratireducens]|uniref:Gfo/Idh/MocA family protein n=1 Tax=Aquipuribacter nitratireducens TaxID=650104 RepID=A0ABW0GP87_9MICO
MTTTSTRVPYEPVRDRPVRWGVVGPGRIANGVVRDLREQCAADGVLHAVASRSVDRARVFADEHGAAVAYGSYLELLDDSDVDVVYVATPHRQHHQLALAALERGKHLLVEKAFTCTLAGAEEVVAAARERGLFVMEAMWTRFQPTVVRLRELVAEGAVGDVRSVRADLGLRVPFDAADRLWDPAQGGGALLDLGVYPLSWLQMVLGGRPTRLDHVGSLAHNGVDAESTLLWHAEDGRHGVASCSLLSPLPGAAAVFGGEGWIEVPPRFHHPDRLLVHRRRDGRSVESTEEVVAPARGTGYSHELDEVHRCLREGLTESPTMPLDDTLAVMGVLEEALHRLGITFTEDDAVV